MAFQILWLRRLIRRYTSPIPVERAELWKTRLSFGYMFLAWNAFGFVVYAIYQGKADWAAYYGVKKEDDSSPAQQWSKILGIKNATVYRVEGFDVNKYQINNEEETVSNTETTNELSKT